MRIRMTADTAGWTRSIVLVALAFPLLATARPPAAGASVAITEVTIVDVEHGLRTAPRTVLIEAGRIAAIVAPADAHILAAAEVGQRSAEHLMQACEACSSIESTLIDERRELEGDRLDTLLATQEARVLAAYDPATCTCVGRSLARSAQA